LRYLKFAVVFLFLVTLIDSAGTVFFMGNQLRYAFPSPEVFFSWGHTFSEIVQANDADLQLQIGPVVELLR
jgi:hypothetical protein